MSLSTQRNRAAAARFTAAPCRRTAVRSQRATIPVRMLSLLLTAVLASTLLSSCGHKTPLELPKKAQPAKPAP